MKTFQLTQNNKFIFAGTENECYFKLQRVQGQSADWAMKYEGYKVEPIQAVKSTNSNVYQYILDGIDGTNYSVDFANDTEKLQFVADTFKKEFVYENNLKRYGTIQNCLANWFMGLPSAISIDFENYEILQRAMQWGTLQADAKESRQDAVINNWFNLMALKTIQLAKKHGVSFN